MTFADHFSGVAAQYAASRPRYPDELFKWLASQVPTRSLAWDAGCGTGQASGALAAHFAHVSATDASSAQIARAEAHPRVTYAVCGEQNPTLANGTVELVTVAQALHWFNRAAFYREVSRVLAPQGLLAAWTYELAQITPDIDAPIQSWYRDVLGDDWPPERKHVETKYRDIDFPYQQIQTPPFAMSVLWTRAQFVAYLRIWSAVTAFSTRTGGEAIRVLEPALEATWPDGVVHLVRWPLAVLAGRASTAG